MGRAWPLCLKWGRIPTNGDSHFPCGLRVIYRHRAECLPRGNPWGEEILPLEFSVPFLYSPYKCPLSRSGLVVSDGPDRMGFSSLIV